MSSYASCCVLSYNRPQFLKHAISTLLDNAKAPFELIVHDDGSTDRETLQLLYDWQREGIISTLILNAPGNNEGQGVALNRMFNIATGDPIIKLDQDLIFKSGWLKEINSLLNSNYEAACRQIEPEIGLLGLFHYHHEPCDSANTRIEQFIGWSSRTHILGSAFAVTRRCWEQLGPFSERSEAFAEDWEFQRAVTNSQDFVCGLPDQDLVENQGFGIGRSTVVTGPTTVQSIQKQPLVHGADR